MGVRVAEVGEERRSCRSRRRQFGVHSRRRVEAVRQDDVRAQAGRDRLRLQERLILGLRRRRPARREVPEHAVAAADDGPPVAL